MSITAHRIACPTCGGRAYWIWKGTMKRNARIWECRSNGCPDPRIGAEAASTNQQESKA